MIARSAGSSRRSSGSSVLAATSTRNSKRLEIPSNPEKRTTRSSCPPAIKEKTDPPDWRLDRKEKMSAIDMGAARYATNQATSAGVRQRTCAILSARNSHSTVA